MELARTEEQQELAATVRALLTKRSDSAAVRAAITSAAGYDAALWQALCEQVGVAALAVPEEYDGFGASLVETAVVLEELGENLAPAPLPGQRPGRRGPAPARLARRPAPTCCPGSPPARSCRSHSGTSSSSPASGPARWTRPCGSRWPDRPPRLPTDVRDIATALVSALQVGAMQRGLRMTVSYSRERVQFGRPIGSFQALKHRMADMLVRLEASRSASWGATAAAAAYLADPSAENATTLARLAPAAGAYCSEALDHIASETVQLHGGIAITWEHDAHLVFKRAHALAQLTGPAHRLRAAALAAR